MSDSIPPLIRALLRARSGRRCELCGQRQPLEAHHRMQRSTGGHEEVHNLLYVCRPCHDKVHADLAVARANGWIVDSWGDTLTVAVRMFDGWFTVDGRGGLVRLGAS